MTAPPNPALQWPIAFGGVTLIADYEGLRFKAYRCIAGVMTIARGRTTGVVPGQTCTIEDADAWFCADLTAFAAEVRNMCTEAPCDNEFAAMVSLAYNIGTEGFKRSTVLRCHNAKDQQAASRAFGLWNKARIQGVLQEVPGLTARRAAEAALYLTPDDSDIRQRMPQAVAEETSMAASPTVRTGAAAVGVGTVSVVAEAGSHLGEIGTIAAQGKTLLLETLGLAPDALLPGLLVLFGAVVIWRRFGQRFKGWV